MNRSLLAAARAHKAWTLIKVVGILLLGLLFGVIAAFATATLYKQSMIDRARTARYALNVEEIKRLPGAEDDVKLQEYQDLKKQLTHLHKANRDSRFFYVMGERDGGIFFYGDSETPGSPDESPPGQTFDEASPKVRESFALRRDTMDGPTKDRWGTWLSALTPIFDDSGKFVGVLGMDVPARQYMTVLAAAAAFPILVAVIAAVIIAAVDVNRRRRQEAIEVQAELVSVITHELNNPLTGIRWGSELLLSSYYKEGTGANVARAIYASVRKLQESVDDVLEIARLGRKAGQLNFLPIKLTPLIQEVFATQKLPADHKQVLLKLAENWPTNLEVMCDESKMKRVFNNLISNAVKYTNPNTDVLVSYENVEGMHRISVKDHGIGIPKDEQAKVFAGFYRATNAVRSGELGTGMGLFLVKKTMQQHGGRVTLESEQNEGTTITIELPHVIPKAAPGAE